MISAKNKNTRNGIIGTILFHIILFILFLFMGLTYRIPPPPEEGISINFGYNDEGFNKIQPEEKSLESNPVKEEVNQELIEVEEELITQESIETEVVDVKEEVKENKLSETETKEENNEEEPVINQKALYTGKKNNEKESDGNKEKKNNQGTNEGDIKSLDYEDGGIGNNGEAYQLLGRNVSYKATPIYNVQTEGIVVVDITVDRLGNVINAIAGVKGSTTLNTQLLKRAKEAALKTKFSAKESAPTRQQGKIIYNFQLN